MRNLNVHEWAGVEVDVAPCRSACIASDSDGVAPWPTRARHDLLVQLHVSRVEGVADSAATEGCVHVLVGWDIIRPLDGRVPVRRSTDDRGGTWRVGDSAGRVTGLDSALARVARHQPVPLPLPDRIDSRRRALPRWREHAAAARTADRGSTTPRATK